MKNTDADLTNEMWGRRENGRMLAIFACDFVASNRSKIQSCTRKLMCVPFFLSIWCCISKYGFNLIRLRCQITCSHIMWVINFVFTFLNSPCQRPKTMQWNSLININILLLQRRKKESQINGNTSTFPHNSHTSQSDDMCVAFVFIAHFISTLLSYG